MVMQKKAGGLLGEAAQTAGTARDIGAGMATILLGLAAGTGFGAGFLTSKAGKPTNTDVGNMQNFYLNKRLDSDIDRLRTQLKKERTAVTTIPRSIMI